MERSRAFMFPEARSVVERDLEWHAAKLAEETGEVASAILDRETDSCIEEIMDVIQVCENILRRLWCTDDMYEVMIGTHISKCRSRGYYVDEDEG